MKKTIVALTVAGSLFSPIAALAYTIDAGASQGGSISPAGSVIVAPGFSQFFNIGAQGGNHVVSVSVDGASVGTPSEYLFDNVSADHSIFVTAASNLSGGLLYCSGPMAPGWNVSLPNGGCPLPVQRTYAPSFTVVEKDGSFTLRAGKLIQ